MKVQDFKTSKFMEIGPISFLVFSGAEIAVEGNAR